jgi:hypothetical protein
MLSLHLTETLPLAKTLAPEGEFQGFSTKHFYRQSRAETKPAASFFSRDIHYLPKTISPAMLAKKANSLKNLANDHSARD